MLTQHRLKQGDWIYFRHNKTGAEVAIHLRLFERQAGTVFAVICDDEDQFLVDSGECKPFEFCNSADGCRPAGGRKKARGFFLQLPAHFEFTDIDPRIEMVDQKEAFESTMSRISNPLAREYFRMLYLEDARKVDAMKALGISPAESIRMHRHAAKEITRSDSCP